MSDKDCGCGCGHDIDNLTDIKPVKPEGSPCCPPPPVEDQGCGCADTQAPIEEQGCGCADTPAPTPTDSCCGSDVLGSAGDPMERPGIRVWPFVEEWLDTPVGQVPKVSHKMEFFYDVLGRWTARWDIGRYSYRIAPGVYAFGSPTADSPVLVTCNYKLTFDHLRKDWAGLDAWVLVLETYGINVWCAAGKGTFGTDELVRRVKATGLDKLVNHRDLVVPQLGAPGVSAHKVKKQTGFKVNYGPVRHTDVKRYLADGMKADEQMRQVTFTTMERLILTPVEIMMLKKYILYMLIVAFVISGIGPSVWSPVAAFTRGLALFGACAVGILAGAVATPVLLPKIPATMFSSKGALAGGALALLSLLAFGGGLNWLEVPAFILASGAVSAFAAMNFTGTSTFTSPTGVEKEMRKTMPWQAGAAAAAVLGWIAGAFVG